ncbi:hypothetical protein NC653_035761 [Populus alba x Populus x berolinensis]|uniref:Uncharacterized protein n=1 Tax=Populus alba x Populus x berolinensis TaxID=444605 RepID=A0AAD6LKU6_9ROSI|nr:hypothetical protein NC653_035761 [Populus alba x Populus x berolinensis]
MDDEQDSIDLADDVDTYGGGEEEEEEDVADDKDRAGVFQSATRTFGDGSIGLEKSDLARGGDNYQVSSRGPSAGTTASITTTVMAVERSERGDLILTQCECIVWSTDMGAILVEKQFWKVA